MAKDKNDEKSLRAAALQTSKSILLARQRAEQKLIRINHALEQKTKDLAHSLALMRATLESTTDGILVTDGLGKITDFNEKFVTMWGMPRQIMKSGEDAKRQTIASQKFKEPKQFLARIKQIENSGIPESYDVLELLDGKIYERFSKLHGADESNSGRVWCFRDITERKQGEDSLRKANKAKDDFLATLSHELRTPLSPVLMTATALREDARLPSDVREQLAMIERNIALETRLIDDLLDITAISHGKLRLRTQMCDAHSLIGLAVEIVRDEVLTKEISIKREFSAQLSGLVADPARFQQVIWNLLRNAIKFTPRGGWIAIRTLDREANWLRIEVIDSGIGLEPDSLEKIFLPFEQGNVSGNHRFGGIGLGLAIARAIVDLHGGKINAQSAGVNQGTTFIVELPGAITPVHGVSDTTLRSSVNQPVVSTNRKTSGVGKKPLRLLLVEDHAPTLQVMSNLLKRDGYTVVAAGTVADALAAAAANSFDLLVSDLGLPDGTGNQLMEKLREKYGLRGIALSGYGMEEDILRGQEAGFIAHLIKPVSIADLRRVLTKIAEDKTPISTELRRRK